MVSLGPNSYESYLLSEEENTVLRSVRAQSFIGFALNEEIQFPRCDSEPNYSESDCAKIKSYVKGFLVPVICHELEEACQVCDVLFCAQRCFKKHCELMFQKEVEISPDTGIAKHLLSCPRQLEMVDNINSRNELVIENFVSFKTLFPHTWNYYFSQTNTEEEASDDEEDASDGEEETYYDHLWPIESHCSHGSNNNLQQLHGTTKIQCWNDDAESKSCYDTRDLTANIRHGVTSFTQPSILSPVTDQIQQQLAEIERLREEVKRETERANAATERANVATRSLIEVDKKYTQLEEKMNLMQEQLTMIRSAL